jgi:Putative transposase DNA-binding domain
MSGELLCLARPARIDGDSFMLDAEFRSARWTYHRLLDVEDEHQRFIDSTAEECAPGITRCGRLVARLRRRARRRERTTAGQWSPHPHPDLLARLMARLGELRAQRNADPDWKESLRWFDEPGDGAPKRGTARRRAGETEEQYAERCVTRRTKLTRREERRAALYTQRRIHWSSWNALVAAVDQARKAVLQARKAGLPADWHRPRWDDDNTLTFAPGCWRVLEQGSPWWTLELRLFDSWVPVKSKWGNWHTFDPKNIRRIQLTRRKSGRGWKYSLTASIAEVRPASKARLRGSGLVALDWGHREHGHPNEKAGMRVFTWLGADGESGEILLPAECRELANQIAETTSRVDAAFHARAKTLGLPRTLGRHGYRRQLGQLGVLSSEQAAWLAWETRYERRLDEMRARIVNLRRETYVQAIRDLRAKYDTFAIEAETPTSHRKRGVEQMEPHRKRANRELSARYLFVTFCEQYGATLVAVPSRNSTRECPDCGALTENGPELMIACPGCGRVRDKDLGACRVILRRAEQALATQAASA